MGERDACWSKRARYNRSLSFAISNGLNNAASAAPPAAPAATSNASRLLRIAACTECLSQPVTDSGSSQLLRRFTTIRSIDTSAAAALRLLWRTLCLSLLACCKALARQLPSTHEQFVANCYASARGFGRDRTLRPVQVGTRETVSLAPRTAALCLALQQAAASTRNTARHRAP